MLTNYSRHIQTHSMGQAFQLKPLFGMQCSVLSYHILFCLFFLFLFYLFLILGARSLAGRREYGRSGREPVYYTFFSMSFIHFVYFVSPFATK